jgi:hypothetical protein
MDMSASWLVGVEIDRLTGYVLARGRIVAADRTSALRSSSVVRSLYFS